MLKTRNFIKRDYNIGILIHEHQSGGIYIMAKKISEATRGKLILLSSNKSNINYPKGYLKIKTFKLFGKRFICNISDIFSINKKISLWHIHYPSPITLPIYLLSKKPKITTFHFMLSGHHFTLPKTKRLNIILNKTLLTLLYIIILNLIILFSNKITFITNAQREEYKKAILFRKKFMRKSIIINNFIEKSKVVKLKKSYPKSIIFVGRLSKLKGFDNLLKVIHCLKQNIKFIIIGKGKLKVFIPKDKNILYIKNVDNEKILNFYDNSSIFILPSLKEVFPVTIIEAMARGLVILASRIPGIDEIIKEGENGYLFPPGDIEKMKELILYLENNSKEIERISKNNLKDIWKFTAEKQLPKYTKIYKEVLEENEKSYKK
jgi:glycosyltransferase involved in cell wall biosynthesis